MAAQEFASVVSLVCSFGREITNKITVDFAMTEAAFAVVKLLERFPVIKLPAGETVVKTGQERQTITIVLAVGDGCRICVQ